jgi:Na+-transporting methylmalonyl-CoA/oxaloacetate decarboxylase beta subunit
MEFDYHVSQANLFLSKIKLLDCLLLFPIAFGAILTEGAWWVDHT